MIVRLTLLLVPLLASTLEATPQEATQSSWWPSWWSKSQTVESTVPPISEVPSQTEEASYRWSSYLNPYSYFGSRTDTQVASEVTTEMPVRSQDLEKSELFDPSAETDLVVSDFEKSVVLVKRPKSSRAIQTNNAFLKLQESINLGSSSIIAPDAEKVQRLSRFFSSKRSQSTSMSLTSIAVEAADKAKKKVKNLAKAEFEAESLLERTLDYMRRPPPPEQETRRLARELEELKRSAVMSKKGDLNSDLLSMLKGRREMFDSQYSTESVKALPSTTSTTEVKSAPAPKPVVAKKKKNVPPPPPPPQQTSTKPKAQQPKSKKSLGQVARKVSDNGDRYMSELKGRLASRKVKKWNKK